MIVSYIQGIFHIEKVLVMDERDRREKWLLETITEIRSFLDTRELLCRDSLERLIHEYQEELKAMKECECNVVSAIGGSPHSVVSRIDTPIVM